VSGDKEVAYKQMISRLQAQWLSPGLENRERRDIPTSGQEHRNAVRERRVAGRIRVLEIQDFARRRRLRCGVAQWINVTVPRTRLRPSAGTAPDRCGADLARPVWPQNGQWPFAARRIRSGVETLRSHRGSVTSHVS